MARTPVVKKGHASGKPVVLQPSDACPMCGHLLSLHDEDKTRQCGSCSCVAQDVAHN